MNYKTKYNPVINSTAKIIDCKYFTTNIILFDNEIYKDYFEIDSSYYNIKLLKYYNKH